MVDYVTLVLSREEAEAIEQALYFLDSRSNDLEELRQQIEYRLEAKNATTKP